jgi:sigma-B regulation protein RsbU (phosphoserine phosphatase)
MSPIPEPSNLGQRITDFAARFDENTRRRLRDWDSSSKRGLIHDIYASLKDLCSRDVTRDSLENLIRHEARDTIRFFKRGMDFAALRSLPWYQRHPRMAGRAFLAAADRLSPPRRLAFVVAAVAFLIGLLRLITVSVPSGDGGAGLLPAGAGWWLISIVIIVLLLLMELRDKLDLKGDLEIAREIQFGLVPLHASRRQGFVFRHSMRPANTVGGDYYDIVELEDGKLALVIGDVAGKGMPAALLMALLQGSLRTLITAGHRGTDLISKLNDYLCATLPANRLVTLFYAELDLGSSELCYVNAGHNPPLLVRSDRNVERLHSNSMVLGFMKGYEFECGRGCLRPGDCLVLYTDGIVEAFDPDGREYGDARLEQFFKARGSLDDPELIPGLIADVVAFCRNEQPGDDMTVLTVNSAG